MKSTNTKLQAGVWLDATKALVITNHAEMELNDFSILDTIKAAESHGGGSEHTINNAKQADNLKYYKLVSGKLLDYDEIFLFGPGKAQEQLQNHLHDDARFKSKKITIDSAENMTDPQMIAKVRNFFK